MDMTENGREFCCCGNEQGEKVPVGRVIARLDELLARGDTEGAERLLRNWDREARELRDGRGLLQILSEEVGFFRWSGRPDDAVRCAAEAVGEVRRQGLSDHLSGATILLNCATTLCAFGRREEGWPLFETVRRVYDRELPPGDFRRAGLANNMASSLPAEETDRAIELYGEALRVLNGRAEYVSEIAVTYVNMAQAADRKDPLDERIETWLDLAEQALDREDAVRDGNYADNCSKCETVFAHFGRFFAAERIRDRRLEIYERHRAQ